MSYIDLIHSKSTTQFKPYDSLPYVKNSQQNSDIGTPNFDKEKNTKKLILSKAASTILTPRIMLQIFYLNKFIDHLKNSQNTDNTFHIIKPFKVLFKSEILSNQINQNMESELKKTSNQNLTLPYQDKITTKTKIEQRKEFILDYLDYLNRSTESIENIKFDEQNSQVQPSPRNNIHFQKTSIRAPQNLSQSSIQQYKINPENIKDEILSFDMAKGRTTIFLDKLSRGKNVFKEDVDIEEISRNLMQNLKEILDNNKNPIKTHKLIKSFIQEDKAIQELLFSENLKTFRSDLNQQRLQQSLTKKIFPSSHSVIKNNNLPEVDIKFIQKILKFITKLENYNQERRKEYLSGIYNHIFSSKTDMEDRIKQYSSRIDYTKIEKATQQKELVGKLRSVDFNIPGNLNINENLIQVEGQLGYMRHIDQNTRDIHSHLDHLYLDCFKMLKIKNNSKTQTH